MSLSPPLSPPPDPGDVLASEVLDRIIAGKRDLQARCDEIVRLLDLGELWIASREANALFKAALRYAIEYGRHGA